jgi:hypothetical protein
MRYDQSGRNTGPGTVVPCGAAAGDRCRHLERCKATKADIALTTTWTQRAQAASANTAGSRYAFLEPMDEVGNMLFETTTY